MGEQREDLLSVDIDSIVDAGNKKGSKKSRKIIGIVIVVVVLVLGSIFALRPISYRNACLAAEKGDFSTAAEKLKYVGNYKGCKANQEDLKFLATKGAPFIEIIYSSFTDGENGCECGYSMEDRAFSAKTVYPHKAEELFSNPTPEVYFSWLSTTESIDQLSQEFSNILKEDGFEGNFQIGVVDSNSEVIYTSKNGEATFEYANEEELAEEVFSSIYSKIVKLAKEKSFDEAATEWDKFCNGKTFNINYKDLANYVSYVEALRGCTGENWAITVKGVQDLRKLPHGFECVDDYLPTVEAAIKPYQGRVYYSVGSYDWDKKTLNVGDLLNIDSIVSTPFLDNFSQWMCSSPGATTLEISNGELLSITAECHATAYPLGFVAYITFDEATANVEARHFEKPSKYDYEAILAKDYAIQYSLGE